MRKWLITGTVLLLWLGITGLAWGQQLAAETPKTTITGTYDVTFTSHQGQEQSAKILIEDLKNGKVQASGDYKGYPVSIVGDLSGDVAKEGAVCSFNINKPGLVTGQAKITIQLVDDKYQLQGSGNGSYSYLGTSGEISGQVIGSRPNPAADSNSSSPSTPALIIGLLFLLAILIYIVWRRRKKKVRS